MYDEIKKFSFEYKSNYNNKLASLNCNKETFFFNSCAVENDNKYNRINQPWIVVKEHLVSNKENLYKISIGDIVKIGRVKLRLKEIFHSKSLPESNTNKKELDNTNTRYEFGVIKDPNNSYFENMMTKKNKETGKLK